MVEHRGLWAALGVALLTVGLGGLISRKIADEVANPPVTFQWLDGISALCWICVAVGLVAAYLVAAGIRRTDKRREGLNRRLERGNQLLVTVRQEADEAKAPTLEAEVDAWATEVHAWLASEIPDSTGRFLNEAGHGVQFTVSGREQLSRIGNWLERRLARLREVQP